MISVSTHVLDASAGGPRVGVDVTLEAIDGTPKGAGVSDVSGRVDDLAIGLTPGQYRLRWMLTERPGLLSEVSVVVDLTEERHYHLPLLASPASAVTYLGV